MKKNLCVAISVLVCSLLLSSCGGNKSDVSFNGMLDSDSGKVYKLGDSKEIFDDAFGEPTFNEKRNEYSYLSDVLTIAYDEDDCAILIESSGKSNRFEFYDFNFDKPIKEIEGRYEKYDGASGYIFYHKYFDNNGDVCSLLDAAYIARLMVRDGDMEVLHLKDGEYVSYSIEKR